MFIRRIRIRIRFRFTFFISVNFVNVFQCGEQLQLQLQI